MMQIRTTSGVELASSPALQAEVLLVMPCTNLPMAQRAATQMAQRAGAAGQLLLVQDTQGWGFIRVVNHVFKNTLGRYFGYVAQDAYAGRQWLALALEALQRPGKSLLGFNDGKWHGAFAGFGLAERQWASQNYPGADFFQSGYSRHFADVEISILAISQGRYVHDPRSLLVEVDWAKDGAPVDAHDRAHYRTRAAAGFDARVSAPERLTLVA